MIVEKAGSEIYLGEDGGPDGLNLLDLGGSQESLDLVGLSNEVEISWCLKFVVAQQIQRPPFAFS